MKLLPLIGRTALALALVAPVAGIVPANAAPPTPSEPMVAVSIAEVDLSGGPAIRPVSVTVANNSPNRLSKLKLTLTGPQGWALYPSTLSVKEALRSGESVTVDFQIHVPEQTSAGIAIRTFTAFASYSGADGLGTATGERRQVVGTPLPDFAAARNNVGSTALSTVAAGNLDGYGNSFSAERLAEKGVTPGATILWNGASFTWPDVAPGTAPDNVSGAGQTVYFSGQGSRLAFLGTGIAAPSGSVTVWYTDGTTSTGSFYFPNWLTPNPTANGATPVITMQGRNTPSGYANAEYQYHVYGHSVAIDPSRTVSMVTLPSAGGIHIFSMALVP